MSKIALVTGGASGVGAAIATRLAQDGCTVAVADIDLAAARRQVDALQAAGATASAHVVDVRRPEEVERLMREVLQRHGRLDIVINNAGVLGPCVALVEVTDRDVDAVLDVNVKGVVHCLRVALPIMLRQGSGAIVNMASTAAKEGPALMSLYSASKAAVVALTKSAAREVARDGIRINCVSPTLIADTGMEKAMPDAFRENSIRQIPMGRPARPPEVAAVVAFLASDDASFVTGQCYDVSGGRSNF